MQTQLYNLEKWMKLKEEFSKELPRILKIKKSTMTRCRWRKIWLISTMICLKWFNSASMARCSRRWTWALRCVRMRPEKSKISRTKPKSTSYTRLGHLWCRRLSITNRKSKTKPRLSIASKARTTTCSWWISVSSKNRIKSMSSKSTKRSLRKI